MEQLVQPIVNGLSLGSIMALSAVGLTLTYGILRLSNFAHGDLMTLAAYLTFLFNSLGLNIWLAMGLSTIVVIGFALLTDKFLWAPMRKQRTTPTTLIIISIGLALAIRNGVIMVWGASPQNYDLPVAETLNFWGVRVPFNSLLVMGMALAAIGGLHYLLQNTKIGKAMRAVADDIDLARVTGIKVDRVILWTWVIAAGLTAVSGSMLGLIEKINPNMGWFLILPLFASVILGGIGNPYGAIVGAFVIGLAQEVGAGMRQILGDAYLTLLQNPVLAPIVKLMSPDYKIGIALLIMMLVLLLRPQGLFRGTM
ncbi:branched-chain amino acid ABC transporter permease [Alkalinema pantanalense CENA528]|uniref:branched-chain amino acid ABC transporter permease n=1 Tax=Alkalinema pantanalense TaxID=1620705 RepID=UPI003D6E79F5